MVERPKTLEEQTPSFALTIPQTVEEYVYSERNHGKNRACVLWVLNYMHILQYKQNTKTKTAQVPIAHTPSYDAG